jgi:hypothetical protein
MSMITSFHQVIRYWWIHCFGNRIDSLRSVNTDVSSRQFHDARHLFRNSHNS